MAAPRRGPPDEYHDPMSLELMEDPVMLVESGQTYERKVIEEHLRRRKSDPLSNDDLKSEPILVPNIALRKLIQDWKIHEQEAKEAERKAAEEVEKRILAERRAVEEALRKEFEEIQRRSLEERRALEENQRKALDEAYRRGFAEGEKRAIGIGAERKAKEPEKPLSIIFNQELDSVKAEQIFINALTEAHQKYAAAEAAKDNPKMIAAAEEYQSILNKWLIRRSATVPEYCFTISYWNKDTNAVQHGRFALLHGNWIPISGKTKREDILSEIKQYEEALKQKGLVEEKDALQGLLQVIPFVPEEKDKRPLKAGELFLPNIQEADNVFIPGLTIENFIMYMLQESRPDIPEKDKKREDAHPLVDRFFKGAPGRPDAAPLDSKDLEQIYEQTLNETTQFMQDNNPDKRAQALAYFLKTLLEHKYFADYLGIKQEDIPNLIMAYRGGLGGIDKLLQSPGSDKYLACIPLLNSKSDQELLHNMSNFPVGGKPAYYRR